MRSTKFLISVRAAYWDFDSHYTAKKWPYYFLKDRKGFLNFCPKVYESCI